MDTTKINRNAVVREQVAVDNTCNAERVYNISAEATYCNNLLESVVNGVVRMKDAEDNESFIASFNKYNSDAFSINFYNQAERAEIMASIDSFITDLTI